MNEEWELPETPEQMVLNVMAWQPDINFDHVVIQVVHNIKIPPEIANEVYKAVIKILLKHNVINHENHEKIIDFYRERFKRKGY